jgi:hypothetical protein
MRLSFPHIIKRCALWASLAVGVCCSSDLVHSQSPSGGHAGAAGTHSTTGPFQIAGTLLNAVTGEPVRHATVAVLSFEDNKILASAVSDNEGHFALQGLPLAKYQLTASKRGFLAAFYDEHDEFSSAVVTGADQDTGHLTFRMTPNASVHGVITADDGDPVEGARVLLFERPKHPGPGAKVAQADAAVTDDTGAYEFTDLAAGEYLIAVVAEPWYAMHSGKTNTTGGGANPELDVVYPVTYYDSTADVTAARSILLSGGSREVADISLHAVPSLHLTLPAPRKRNGGIARPELAQIVFGTSVASESSGFLDSLRTGEIEMDGLAPGRYQLTQGDPPRVVDLDLTSSLQISADIGAPAVEVAGILRSTSGMPVTGELNITLDRIDSGPGVTELATVARDGRFKFETVPQGSWLLWVVGTKPMTVVATNAAGRLHAGNAVTIRDRSLQLAVTLSQSEIRIEGFTDKGGKGLGGMMIVLAPKDPGAWQALVRRDQSDTDGSFTLRNVAPGQYTLFAIEDGWDLAWSQPEAMARYLSRGTAINVAAESGKSIRLDAPIVPQTR